MYGVGRLTQEQLLELQQQYNDNIPILETAIAQEEDENSKQTLTEMRDRLVSKLAAVEARIS